MPDSNLADFGVLSSSFYNTYIREQVVVTCTSGTRPTGVEGRLIYETDTDLLRVYDGSAWQRVANDSGKQVVSGFTSGTTDLNGDLPVSFGVTFAAAPIVVFTVVRASSQQHAAHLTAAPSTTGCTPRITVNDAVLASTAVSVYWIAVGRIA